MKLIICLSVIVQGIAYNTPKYINEMARTNYKLVPYFAKSYIKKHKLTYEQREDMIQEGYIGFMYACRSFNESKGLKISTYSKFWIQKYMSDYIKLTYKRKIENPLMDKVLPDYDYYPEFNLDVLSILDKELIIKRYYKNMKVIEMASYYKVSRNTMSNWIKKAVNKLKNQIE